MSAAQRVLLPRRDLVPASRLLALHGDVTEHPDGDPGAWMWRASPIALAPPVIAIDVGADAAAAVIADDHAHVVPFRFPALDGASLEALDDALHDVGERVVRPLFVVEDVFLARGPKANPRTSAGLSRRVGAIVAACAVHGPVVRVLATQWQSDMLGKASRDAGKRRSLDVARARLPKLAIGSDHESDALCLALWARGGRGPR